MPFVNGEKIRHLFVFLLFMVVASSLWLLKALNEEYETDITVGVTVTGLPEGVEIEADGELEMVVCVHDRGTSLVGYMLGTPPMIKVDYSELTDDNGRLSIPVSQLKNRVASRLYSSTVLLHFKDEKFKANIRKEHRELPVNVPYNISAQPHYEVKSVRVVPDYLSVDAPSSVLSWLNEIDVEGVNCSGLVNDTVIGLRVLTDAKYADIASADVELRVDVEPLVTRRIDVPLTLSNTPGDAVKVKNSKYVYDVPDSVSLEFEVSKDDCDAVSAADFVAELDFNDIKAKKAKSLRVNMSKVPGYVVGGAVIVTPANVEIKPNRVRSLFKSTISPAEK